MAEVTANGEPIDGGLPLPSPDEVRIRAQNARRVSRRAQAASLAFQVSQTAGEDLDRFGDTRVVGGTFRSIQDVPDRERPSNTGLNLDDLMKFLGTLNFEGRTINP